MNKKPRFQDTKGVIEKTQNHAYKEYAREFFRLSNYLHDMGFTGTSLQLSSKRGTVESYHDASYYHYEELKGRLRVPPFIDLEIDINNRKYAQSYIYKLPERRNGLSISHSTVREVSSGILYALRENIVKAYGNEHTPDKQRPKLTLILNEDNEARYRFIQPMLQDIERKTGGVKVPVIKAADYVPPPSFGERFLQATGLRRPVSSPALPAPAATLSEELASLPSRFEAQLAQLKDDRTRQLGQKASASIHKAIDILSQDFDKAVLMRQGVSAVFQLPLRRELKRDLTIISLGLDEFDFANSDQERLARYFQLTAQGLESRFERAIQNKAEIGHIGEKVILEQLQRRFPAQNLTPDAE